MKKWSELFCVYPSALVHVCILYWTTFIEYLTQKSLIFDVKILRYLFTCVNKWRKIGV